jgi:hypothetical protein
MAIPQRDRTVFREVFNLYEKYQPVRLTTGDDFAALSDDIQVVVAKCEYSELAKRLCDALYTYFSDRYEKERSS